MATYLNHMTTITKVEASYIDHMTKRWKSTAFLADVIRLSPHPIFKQRAWGQGHYRGLLVACIHILALGPEHTHFHYHVIMSSFL